MARVLVIHDEHDPLESVVQFLQCEGHSVSTAIDERSVAREFLDNSIDAIIVDEDMFQFSGLSHLVGLRTIVLKRDIPLILLTGDTNTLENFIATTLDVYYTFAKANLKLTEVAQAIAQTIARR